MSAKPPLPSASLPSPTSIVLPDGSLRFYLWGASPVSEPPSAVRSAGRQPGVQASRLVGQRTEVEHGQPNVVGPGRRRPWWSGQDKVGTGQGRDRTRSGQDMVGTGQGRDRTRSGQDMVGPGLHEFERWTAGQTSLSLNDEERPGNDKHEPRPAGLTTLIEPPPTTQLVPAYTVAPTDEPRSVMATNWLAQGPAPRDDRGGALRKNAAITPLPRHIGSAPSPARCAPAAFSSLPQARHRCPSEIAGPASFRPRSAGSTRCVSELPRTPTSTSLLQVRPTTGLESAPGLTFSVPHAMARRLEAQEPTREHPPPSPTRSSLENSRSSTPTEPTHRTDGRSTSFHACRTHEDPRKATQPPETKQLSHPNIALQLIGTPACTLVPRLATRRANS